MVIRAMPDRNVSANREGWDSHQCWPTVSRAKRFSGPNDLVIKSNGAIYFTDSILGLRGAGASPQESCLFSGFTS